MLRLQSELSRVGRRDRRCGRCGHHHDGLLRWRRRDGDGMTRGNLSAASDATLHLRNLGARARDVLKDSQRGGGEEENPGEPEERPRVVFNVPGAVVGVVSEAVIITGTVVD